jgi:hypothetical protein
MSAVESDSKLVRISVDDLAAQFHSELEEDEDDERDYEDDNMLSVGVEIEIGTTSLPEAIDAASGSNFNYVVCPLVCTMCLCVPIPVPVPVAVRGACVSVCVLPLVSSAAPNASCNPNPHHPPPPPHHNYRHMIQIHGVRFVVV